MALAILLEMDALFLLPFCRALQLTHCGRVQRIVDPVIEREPDIDVLRRAPIAGRGGGDWEQRRADGRDFW